MSVRYRVRDDAFDGSLLGGIIELERRGLIEVRPPAEGITEGYIGATEKGREILKEKAGREPEFAVEVEATGQEMVMAVAVRGLLEEEGLLDAMHEAAFREKVRARLEEEW